MKRIFIAVSTTPSEEFTGMISSLKARLGNERITWVDTGNVHLTIVFLGDTEEERIKVAGVVLKQKCTGFGEFSFDLCGTGVFRNYRDARIIWAGIPGPGRLIDLNSLIVSGLKDAGFSTGDRPFSPHVTIGRIKSLRDPATLRSAVENYNGTFFQKVDVKEVILFESILKPAGPVYRPLGIFKLA